MSKFVPEYEEYKSTFCYEFICEKCNYGCRTSIEHGIPETIETIKAGHPVCFTCREAAKNG